MTKLEQAIQKLERIRNEQETTQKAIRFEHDQIPFGQPNIIGRSDIYKKVNAKYEKSRRLFKEEEKQKQKIEMLEKVETLKEENNTLKDIQVVGKATVGAKNKRQQFRLFQGKIRRARTVER